MAIEDVFYFNNIRPTLKLRTKVGNRIITVPFVGGSFRLTKQFADENQITLKELDEAMQREIAIARVKGLSRLDAQEKSKEIQAQIEEATKGGPQAVKGAFTAMNSFSAQQERMKAHLLGITQDPNASAALDKITDGHLKLTESSN